MLVSEEFLSPLLDLVDQMKGVTQEEAYHPEGDVQNHALQVFGFAVRESNDVDLIIAALMHDVGKIITSASNDKRIYSHGHDIVGAEMLNGIATVKTIFMVSQHMRIVTYLDGTMRKVGKARGIGNHPWLPCMVALYRWDRMGRNKNRKLTFDRAKVTEKINRAANNNFDLALT